MCDLYRHRVHDIEKEWSYVQIMKASLRKELTVKEVQQQMANNEKIKTRRLEHWPTNTINVRTIKKEQAKPDYWNWGI